MAQGSSSASPYGRKRARVPHAPGGSGIRPCLPGGGPHAFSIAEHPQLHAIFRPFVLAAQRTRPKTLQAEPPPRDQLRSLAAMDVVRKHSSLTPVEASKDKRVESDKALASKMLNTISDARQSPNLRVVARPIPIGDWVLAIFSGPISLLVYVLAGASRSLRAP